MKIDDISWSRSAPILTADSGEHDLSDPTSSLSMSQASGNILWDLTSSLSTSFPITKTSANMFSWIQPAGGRAMKIDDISGSNSARNLTANLGEHDLLDSIGLTLNVPGHGEQSLGFNELAVNVPGPANMTP